MRHVLTGVALILLLPHAPSAQSLADLARLEAARRQGIHGPVPVVTNADLDIRPAPVAPILPPFPVVASSERAPGALSTSAPTSFWSTPWPEPEIAPQLVIVNSSPRLQLHPGYGMQGFGEARAARQAAARQATARRATRTAVDHEAGKPVPVIPTFRNPSVDALFARPATTGARRRPR